MTLDEHQQSLIESNPADFSDLTALVLNCTLKRSPRESHTDRLLAVPIAIMKKAGLSVQTLRPVDHAIPPGVEADMTEHGWEKDEWPEFYAKILSADILILGTPIWLGEESSVCRIMIERLYGMGGELNDKDQSVYYGRAAGAIVTGNEDGIKHCSMTILYALQHLGFAIPPQADAGWIGEAGPGPSYGDDGAGLDNDFTRRNTGIMTWNLMHMARMLKDAGGFPAHGNQRSRT